MTKLFERASEYRSVSVSEFVRSRRGRCSYGLRIVLVAVLCVSIWAGQGIAGPKAKVRPQSYGYFDFPTCVRYALVHSDVFLRNRIDIQVRSIDLKDSHSELLPTVQLLTRYYLTRTGGPGAGKVNVQLFMTNWNPYLALLKIKSTGIMVDIAKTAHHESIADNVAKMAKLFYSISLLEKSIRATKQMTALERHKVEFGRSREEQGRVDDLSLRSWNNVLRSRQIQLKSLKHEREQQIAKLKKLIGYHPDYHLPLDTRDAVNQILRGFNGQSVTFADIQANNLPLKILAKREQLQSNSVTGSYVALLPRPVILFEEIQNEVDRRSGFNLALGLDYTLWDGFRRVRDIKRQKLNARTAELRRKQLSEDLYIGFKTLRDALGLSTEKEAFAREQAEIAELAEEQAFVTYKAGDVDYPEYMNRRIQKVQAQLDAAKSGETRVISLIELATMAGGLNRYNAGIRY